MRELIKKILNEEIKNNKVICDNCGWSWDISEGGDDTYTCHKCGHDNSPKPQSNLNRLLDRFKSSLPKDLQPKIDVISDYIVNYIQENNFTVKFLNSCSTGFAGVRTKDQIIICSPNLMATVGDFLYTIFHEIRHEQQIRDLKMDNPLADYDLDDFEKLYQKYWEMELDADKFAKTMVAKIVMSLNIPMEVAKQQFKLSQYIENYPSMSKMVEASLRYIIHQIKQIKQSGGEFTDIQDHPMVKQYIDKLENFI